MKKRISLIIISVFVLLMFTGCSVNNEENIANPNNMKKGVANSEERNGEEVNNQEDNNESLGLLTEEEALKIGYDLYDYGEYPGYYDSATNKDYTGKSKRENKFEESVTIDEVFLGYPFGNNEDIDNYFTEKRIKELEKQEEPYRIKKIDDLWYFGHAPVGSEPDFLGVILTVKSIEENKVEFVATNYLSFDYLQNGEADYQKYAEKQLYEYIDELKAKYECETEDYNFVIIKEGENWKIDEQNLTHY